MYKRHSIFENFDFVFINIFPNTIFTTNIISRIKAFHGEIMVKKITNSQFLLLTSSRRIFEKSALSLSSCIIAQGHISRCKGDITKKCHHFWFDWLRDWMYVYDRLWAKIFSVSVFKMAPPKKPPTKEGSTSDDEGYKCPICQHGPYKNSR